MITALVVVSGIVMVASALAAMHLRSLVAAIVAVGLMSLFASVLYLVLAAPDVAMTEAAIGAGLSTVIFLYALRQTRDREADDD